MSIEAQYLATKLAKGFLRTMHIESNSRLCMASAGTGYKQSLGADGPPGSYTDFDCTDLFFVIGSNMADCHPILYLRMADRLKAGAKLIVVDPRRTTTAEKADLYLQIKPGTDLALLNGLLHLLVQNGDIDARIHRRTHRGLGRHAGLPGRLPTRPGRRDHRSGRGRHPHRRSDDRRGRGVDDLLDHGPQPEHPRHLEHQRDLQPAPGHRRDLPARQRPDVADRSAQRHGWPRNGLHGAGFARAACRCSRADDRAFVEQQWELAPGTIRTDVGPGHHRRCSSRWPHGEIKACWIICTNPVATVANRQTVIAGLEAAELVITQDAYRDTATNRYADIVLPATLWAESDAVMVNSDRNLTLLQQSIPPAGEARPDWELICQVAEHLGFGEHFDYKSSEQIFDEIRRFHNPRTGYDLRGASYRAAAGNPVAVARAARTTPQRPPPDPLPQRRGQPGPVRRRRRARRPRLAFPTPSRRAVFHPAPAHGRPPNCPMTTTRWCSTPVGCNTNGTP